jgi:hypothetical protein
MQPESELRGLEGEVGEERDAERRAILDRSGTRQLELEPQRSPSARPMRTLKPTASPSADVAVPANRRRSSSNSTLSKRAMSKTRRPADVGGLRGGRCDDRQ